MNHEKKPVGNKLSLSVQQKTYQTALLDLEFPFRKLQFCNRYITVQLQQFKK